MTMRAGFDYVVIGAGAAGCVVAGRLAAAGAQVVVVEAGGSDRNPLIGIPGANVVTGTDPSLNWSYQTQPVASLGQRSLYWAQGRVLGGSGSINGMMYLRGQPEDFDAWSAMGATGWHWDAVLPAFRRSETNERGASDLHGGDGPLHVSKGVATAPVCDLLLEAAGAAGLPVTDDLNRPAAQSFGHVDQTLHRGRRSGPAGAWLHPQRRAGRLMVLTYTRALRLIVEHQRVVGVLCRGPEGEQEIRAEAEVILSAGAVNSPALLLQSGIGPARDLRALGLEVVLDLPGVGGNLQNHPCYKIMYTTSAPVTAYAHVRPLGALKAGLDYVLHRAGPLARGLFPTAGLFRVGPQDHQAMQVCMAPALVIRRRPGILGILPQRHGFTLLLNQGIPRSVGQVTLASADPLAAPRIQPGYFSDPADTTDLIEGIRRLQALMREAPLAGVIEAQIQPAGTPRTDAELAADIASSATTHFHPVGTCRMGLDADAVVTPDLRLRGLDGLRIADASVMPRIVNGNTFAATLMIGERAAEFILGARATHA